MEAIASACKTEGSVSVAGWFHKTLLILFFKQKGMDNSLSYATATAVQLPLPLLRSHMLLGPHVP